MKAAVVARLRNTLRVSAVLLATAAAAIAACHSPTAPPVEGVPDELEFSIGGFGAGMRFLRLHGDTVVTLQVPWDYDPVVPIDSARLIPGPEAWRSFWGAVGTAGVHRWRSRYDQPDIVDGVGWSLTLRSAGFSVRSSGSNAFPDRLGRKHEGDYTGEFRLLLEALSELTGGEF